MNIKSFDRQTLRLLRPELESAFAAVATKYGIAIQLGSGQFDSANATFKLELSAKASDGTTMNKERVAYTQFADAYGLKPEWLDKTFLFRGTPYKIAGLNTKARKAPILAANPQGKRYKFDTFTVKAALSEAPSTPVNHASEIVIGPRNPNHAAIEAEIAEMRNNCPEGYYADGEHRAAGRSEKQIHDLHYRSIARKYEPKYKPLFSNVPI